VGSLLSLTFSMGHTSGLAFGDAGSSQQLLSHHKVELKQPEMPMWQHKWTILPKS